MAFEVREGLRRESDRDPFRAFEVDQGVGVDLFDLQNPEVVKDEVLGVVGAAVKQGAALNFGKPAVHPVEGPVENVEFLPHEGVHVETVQFVLDLVLGVDAPEDEHVRGQVEDL